MALVDTIFARLQEFEEAIFAYVQALRIAYTHSRTAHDAVHCVHIAAYIRLQTRYIQQPHQFQPTNRN